jgi:L-alanine-DL-glutamate epimerase-like enolase superfamily enzyme
MRATDIRLTGIDFSYEDYQYRTPIKFGGAALDRVTLLEVNARVRKRSGAEAVGFGSMPLGNVWSFPSRVLTYAETLDAMKALAAEIARITLDATEYGHPIDLNHALEPQYLQAAEEVTRRLKLAEPIPQLCTLVTASPFDAAIHDAWGKLCGINCYHGYGKDYLEHDVSHYLNGDFPGVRLDQVVTPTPKPSLPLYHLVGALDPITESDITRSIGDGLPETLPAWAAAEGLTHWKIKLNGNDRDWDVARVIAVDQTVSVGREAVYSLDFNEQCPNVEYLLDFMCRLQRHSPALMDRIQYIEQPTARDLSASSNDMHEAARLKPVIIDESLVDYESLLRARELGYSGVALKACKGQSNALLMAAAAKQFGMFLCIQDLTCPGASLIQSAGLAAHVPEVAAIEANARQYVPVANSGWTDRFPGIFRVRDGVMDTSVLTGPGLGAV